MTVHCLTDLNAMNTGAIANSDILFLDIDLGDKNGIDLARGMRKRNPEAVLIFVTNFSEYAPEGYEVDALCFQFLSDLRVQFIRKRYREFAHVMAPFLCFCPWAKQSILQTHW